MNRYIKTNTLTIPDLSGFDKFTSLSKKDFAICKRLIFVYHILTYSYIIFFNI